MSTKFNMFRQSPSRNQRSKGFKVKHVLQICMLLAVCFWLIYQVKHSHDKKKEFDENGAKISVKTQSADEILKFGRKDLPRVQEIANNNEKHEEEEVEEEETGGGEEEENKHEEEEQEEEESKSEEREDEGRGGGDDEIDELDQEKTEGETDREEDFIDEEKEKEEEESEEKEGQFENESSLEDQDHDGGGRNTHEAREEQYKGDDASSAVTHDTQTISTETEEAILENSSENENKSNNTEEINVDQSTSPLKGGEGEMGEDGNSLNVTASEETGNEIISFKSENGSLLNSTITTESNYQVEANNNSTEVSTETPLATVQNGTETILNSTQTENATIDGSTTGKGSNLQTIVPEQANIASNGNQSDDSNSTISTKTEDAGTNTGDSSNSTISEEKIVSPNATADATQNEKLDPTKGTGATDESSGSSSTNENGDEVRHEPIDSSDSSILQEEKEARTDLDTLPEIRTEGTSSEDTAAE